MKHVRKDYMRIQDPLNLIPENEPVFLLRAKDSLSIPLLIRYRELLETYNVDSNQKEMIDCIEENINHFRNWQMSAGAELPTLKNPKEIADILAATETVSAPDYEAKRLEEENRELMEIRAMLQQAVTNLETREKARRINNEKINLLIEQVIEADRLRAIADKQCNEIEMENFNNLKAIETLKEEVEKMQSENVSLRESLSHWQNAKENKE